MGLATGFLFGGLASLWKQWCGRCSETGHALADGASVHAAQSAMEIAAGVDQQQRTALSPLLSGSGVEFGHAPSCAASHEPVTATRDQHKLGMRCGWLHLPGMRRKRFVQLFKLKWSGMPADKGRRHSRGPKSLGTKTNIDYQK